MKKSALAALVLTALVATPALADNSGKFYGALDLGSVTFNGANFGGLNGNTTFLNPGAFRFAGGYNITPMFAVEAGYTMVGDSTISSGVMQEALKSSALSVAGVGNYAINDTFGIFGKLGFANTKVDYTCTPAANCAPVPTAVSGSKTNLTFGLGAQYNINKQFAIRAQYEDLGKVTLQKVYINGTSADVSLKMISIGGVYNF